MKRHLYILLAFLLVIYGCMEFQPTRTYIYNLEIKGIIIDKYIDEQNHNEDKFTTEKFDNTTDSFYADLFSNLWLYTNKSDTIIKNAHSLDLIVKKVNGESKVFNYDNPSN